MLLLKKIVQNLDKLVLTYKNNGFDIRLLFELHLTHFFFVLNHLVTPKLYYQMSAIILIIYTLLKLSNFGKHGHHSEKILRFTVA